MTSKEEYLQSVLELVASVSGLLTDDEKAEVHHLIDHGEPAEGLRTLAWIIVDAGKRVPASTIAGIRELSAGLVDESDLPSGLNAHAAD